MLLQAPYLPGHGGLAGVVGVGEVTDAGRAELVDLGEQPDLGRGYLEAGLPRRPAVQPGDQAQQLVAEGLRGGHVAMLS